MDIILIAILIVFIAAIIQSSTGFGFSITTMMVMPLLFSVMDSMVLINMTNFVAVIFVTVKYYRKIQWRLVVLPLGLSLIGNYIGMSNIVAMNNTYAMMILGSALLLLSFYFFFFSKKIRIPANQATAAMSGTASGLMSGFFSIPGPPMVLYYSVAIKDKEAYIGTIQCFFLINSLFRFAFFMTSVAVTPIIFKVLPFTFVAALLGAFTGNYIFRKAPTEIIHKLIYGFMALSGIYYILR